MSNDGIPKPNFWAFKLLSQLSSQRLLLPMGTNENVEYAAFIDGNTTQILIYAQDNDYEKNEAIDIDLHINQQVNCVTIQRIDDNHCNPKAIWQSMGCPDNLTRSQVEHIKQQTALREEAIPYSSENGCTHDSLVLHTNDVALLTLT